LCALSILWKSFLLNGSYMRTVPSSPTAANTFLHAPTHPRACAMHQRTEASARVVNGRGAHAIRACVRTHQDATLG
jgi:hypothetical protein